MSTVYFNDEMIMDKDLLLKKTDFLLDYSKKDKKLNDNTYFLIDVSSDNSVQSQIVYFKGLEGQIKLELHQTKEYIEAVIISFIKIKK